MFFSQKKIFKNTVCWILILSFLLQSFPQTAQAGAWEDLQNWVAKKIGGVLSKLKYPSELKIADEENIILQLLTGTETKIFEVFLGISNPFYSSKDIGDPDQTPTTIANVSLGIPEICELKVLPPPEENKNFLTQEERFALHKSCYSLLNLKKMAVSQAYYARHIYNKTDPHSECSILNHCKSSCNIAFGSYAYVIHGLDIAKMVLPTGWMETVNKIMEVVKFIQKIKSYYDYYKFIKEEVGTFIANISNTISAVKALSATLKTFLDLSKDDGESFTGLLEHYGKNLINLAKAKSEALNISTQTQKDAEDLIKALQAEDGVRFLFLQKGLSDIEDEKDKEKRDDLEKIIDDYLLAGFETPEKIIGKLKNNGEFLDSYLDVNGNPVKGPPMVSEEDEEEGGPVLSGLKCPAGAESMDANGNATTSQAGTVFCKFQGSSCPREWRPYYNWSGTQSNYGCAHSDCTCIIPDVGDSRLLSCPYSAGNGTGCCCVNTGFHKWANTATEIGGYGVTSEWGDGGSKCEAAGGGTNYRSATITAIGCIPTGIAGIVPAARGICYSPATTTSPTWVWFNKFKEFYREIERINQIFQNFLKQVKNCDECKEKHGRFRVRCIQDYRCSVALTPSSFNAFQDFLTQVQKCMDCKNKPGSFQRECIRENRCVEAFLPSSLPSFANISFNTVISSQKDLLTAVDALPTVESDFYSGKQDTKFWTTSSIDVGCPIDAELIDEDGHYACRHKVECPSGAETVIDENNNGQSFCKFDYGCPAGWNIYYSPNGKPWTETTKATCKPVRMWADCTDCTTGEHFWSNENRESCLWNNNPCESDGYGCCPTGETNSTCYANIRKIGCVPADKTYRPFVPQEWLCDYNPNLAFMDWDGAIKTIKKEEKLEKLANAAQEFSSPAQSTDSALIAKFNWFLINPFISYQTDQQKIKLEAIKTQIQKAIDEVEKANMEPAGSKEATVAVLNDLINSKIPSLQTEFGKISDSAIKIKNIWEQIFSKSDKTITILIFNKEYVRTIVETIFESQTMATNIIRAENIFDELETIGECFLQNDITECIKNNVPISANVVPMDANGNPTSRANAVFYKWPQGSCPGGWVPYLNWSTTRGIYCNSKGASCCGGGCSGEKGCTPSEHSTFQNTPAETCTVKNEYCDGWNCCEIYDSTCTATITAIGCKLGNIKLPQSAKDILKRVFDTTNGSLKEVNDFLSDDSEALKKVVGDYSCPSPEPSTSTSTLFFLNKIKCFVDENGKTFKQILIFIEAMVKVTAVISELDIIKDLVIALDPNRALEKSFDKQCGGNLNECIEDLRGSLGEDPLVTFADEFRDISNRIKKVKCQILDITDMTRGGIPVDAGGATTTDASGTPVVTSDTVFYKFTISDLGGCGENQCPAGWVQHENWSETCGRECRGTCRADYCAVRSASTRNVCPNDYYFTDDHRDNLKDICYSWHDDKKNCGDIGWGQRAYTGEHSWANIEREKSGTVCYERKSGNCTSGNRGNRMWTYCWAKQVAIGCIRTATEEANITEGQGLLASSTAKVKERTENIVKGLLDLEVKIDRAKAVPPVTNDQCAEGATPTPPLSCYDIKTPMREILYVYYFLLGIKAFDALGDIDIKCDWCYKKSDPNKAKEKCEPKDSEARKNQRLLLSECGLVISFDSFKCIYKQAKVFIRLIKCAVRMLVDAVKSAAGGAGKTETSEGKEVKDSTQDTTCTGLGKDDLTAALKCDKDTTGDAGGNTGGKGTEGTGGSGASGSEWQGGWQIKEIARCVVNPAYSLHRVNVGGADRILKDTGPKGGLVCGETNSFFSSVETNFTSIRKGLREIDLLRRKLGIADLFRITGGKFIPSLEKFLDDKDKCPECGIKHPSVNAIYKKAEDIRDSARLVWAISTAINFTNYRCTCGQSFCLFPVCISGLPLTIEAITNPFCYLTYMLRGPLLTAVEKLEEELGKK